ncbi:amino acid adenylation domain-containing protein [Pseudomonas sp. 148P]|uniref:Amino acid adenylation domain-containing protein n=2 Tax=Pseudomonas TaxID=286 RepID=A0ABU7HPY0_9PSED|nr:MULTISPECIES: amino acid adenylation domain-containing protein [unclassified Pseudomonas]MEE1922619.1 amino acid adenylation domain-containing protein [Pseudomonas sp. 147P]MEE1933596.1 amino acid adenylation domain-containing protein [Pseudomonas sp. 148P]
MRALTEMQAACWIGRTTHAALGTVSAHLYAEFDGPAIDLERLRAALAQVCMLHPMLRLRIDHEGQQTIAPPDQAPGLEVDDLRGLAEADARLHLARKRDAWSHQQLDLRHGHAARFGISLLHGGHCRLHVDTDMIAIDPSSFRVLLEDLAHCYEDADNLPATPPTFFDWWDAARNAPALHSARERDRQWWRERLDSIAPAPALPLLDPPATRARSQRLSAWLNPAQRQALRQLARTRRITLSNLLLGLFAAALGAQTGDRQFRLNVPAFWREPLVDDVERIVGEFANVLILDIDLDQADTLAALCAQVARNMIERLDHSAYSGVNLMRDLSRHHGTPQLAPVVFTAALDLPGGELFSPRVQRAFGTLNWVMSQGPQVALDAQIACADGGILVNWDVRLDALPEAWVTALFERFVGLLGDVAAQPAVLDRTLPQPTALTPLQQAYLLGRSTQMPLGGVAMQEFREYRGRLDIAVLRQRLAAMVQRHPGLRTRIDERQRLQWISDDAQLNLDEVDLSHLPLAEALAQIETQREAYAHAMAPLQCSPWNVTVFQLAGGELLVFTRFDALILDGRAIAALQLELLEGRVDEQAVAASASANSGLAAQRKADADYWSAKLASVDGPPRLPWSLPLEQAGAGRYERQSLRVPKETFTTLCRLGARQRLFKNSAVMALLLEVLGRWVSEGGLCVAVPVAPASDAAFANRSSFLTINWPDSDASFVERATQLQVDVLEGLQHLAFSGVDLARQLFEQHGPGPVLPVVITNGLSWPVAARDSAMQLQGGLTQTPQVAMDIRFWADAEGALQVDIDYAHEVLAPTLVADYLRGLQRAIEQIARSGEFAVDAAALIDTAHYRLNTPVSAACRETWLARLAANLFDPGNHKLALVSGERQLSYAELGDGVARIIAALRARGLEQGHVLALCLPRSPEHTMLTLACALTGVIWVPIDAAAPADRRQYLLENCDPDLVVLAHAETLVQPSTTCAALLAEPATPPAELPDLSLNDTPGYYLYTSGTTGRPKCVVLNNRATANVLGATLANWQVSERDVVLSVTPLHHDMSLFDIFGSLTAGATLVLPGPGEDKDALRWNQLVTRHGVTLWCSVPAILEMLLACRGAHDLGSLRLIAQGGDYIKPAVIAELRRLLPDTRLVSLGGPTETTIWSIWHEISEQDRQSIPYGQPLPGNRYFVLDAQGRHCPTGVVGRIHTAGVNLALGYLQDGELLQTDFITVQDEHGESVRAFRSGDCGRYRDDGTLLFDSRVNGYVKVRGVRVSLPDVEMVLSQHPALRHVLVVDYGDARLSELCLGALYVRDPQAAEPGTGELRDYASEHLPQSHVPTRLLAVDALPLSQNGKPDRRRARELLAAPPPATAQDQVLDIYRQVLGLAPDASNDPLVDFVSLGLRPQHLKAISARMHEQFAVPLSPGQLLRCRNAGDVERLLTAAGA